MKDKCDRGISRHVRSVNTLVGCFFILVIITTKVNQNIYIIKIQK